MRSAETALWLALSSEISFYLGFDCQLPEVPVSPLNSVQLGCSLPCQLAGLVHQRCFERLETQGITALGNAKGRAREWSSREKEKVIQVLIAGGFGNVSVSLESILYLLLEPLA